MSIHHFLISPFCALLLLHITFCVENCISVNQVCLVEIQQQFALNHLIIISKTLTILKENQKGSQIMHLQLSVYVAC